MGHARKDSCTCPISRAHFHTCSNLWDFHKCNWEFIKTSQMGSRVQKMCAHCELFYFKSPSECQLKIQPRGQWKFPVQFLPRQPLLSILKIPGPEVLKIDTMAKISREGNSINSRKDSQKFYTPLNSKNVPNTLSNRLRTTSEMMANWWSFYHLGSPTSVQWGKNEFKHILQWFSFLQIFCGPGSIRNRVKRRETRGRVVLMCLDHRHRPDQRVLVRTRSRNDSWPKLNLENRAY